MMQHFLGSCIVVSLLFLIHSGLVADILVSGSIPVLCACFLYCRCLVYFSIYHLGCAELKGYGRAWVKWQSRARWRSAFSKNRQEIPET